MRRNKFLIQFFLPLIFAVTYAYFLFPEIFRYFYVGIPYGLGAPAEFRESFLGGDHFQVYYIAWKLKEFLTSWTFSIFVDPFNFASTKQVFVDLGIGIQYWLIALSSLLFGSDVAGYNFAAIVLSLALTSWAGYRLGFEISRSRLFGVLIGIYLALIPYRIIQNAGGHGGGMVLFLQPLYWSFVFGSFLSQDKRQRDIYAGLAGAALFLITMSDEHQGYYTILTSMMIFPIWGIQAVIGQRSWQALGSYIWGWRYLLVGLVLTVAYGELMHLLTLSNGESLTPLKKTFVEIRTYSSPVPSFFTPNSSLNIGSVLGPAAAIFLLVRIRYFHQILMSPALPIVLATVIMIFLMAGLGSHPSQSFGVYEFFYEHLPYFSYQRVPVKMLSTSAVLLAVLAAWIYRSIGFENNAWKHQNSVSIQKGLRIVLSLCVLGQIRDAQRYFVRKKIGLKIESVQSFPPKVIELITNQTQSDDIIMKLPVRQRMDRYATKTQLLASLTRRRFSDGYNGNAPAYWADAFPAMSALNQGILTRDSALHLFEHGYRFLLVDSHGPSVYLDPAIDSRLPSQPGIDQVGCEEGYCLYRVSLSSQSIQSLNNFGLTGPDEHGSMAGRFMVNQDHIPKITGVDLEDIQQSFSIVSYLKLPESNVPKFRLIFMDYRPFSLFVIRPGMEPLEFPLSTWNKDGNQFFVDFEAPATEIYLATKEFWSGLGDVEVGKHRYGHFIVGLNPLDR